MKLFLEGKKYLLMRSLIMKASLKTLVRLAQFHMSCNITDNAMPFLLVFGLVIIVQSTSPCFKALVKKQPLSVDPRKAILVATRIALFSVDWRKGNSRGDENYCLLCSSEKSSSRILSRVTENWAILVVNGEKQFSSRRELLDSLREFSNSRRNLDENCWIRGENLQILVSPTICPALLQSTAKSLIPSLILVPSISFKFVPDISA